MTSIITTFLVGWIMGILPCAFLVSILSARRLGQSMIKD